MVFWCSRRESNPKLNLRRIPLFPFNYGNLLNDLKDKKVKNNTDFNTNKVSEIRESQYLGETSTKNRNMWDF